MWGYGPSASLKGPHVVKTGLGHEHADKGNSKRNLAQATDGFILLHLSEISE